MIYSYLEETTHLIRFPKLEPYVRTLLNANENGRTETDVDLRIVQLRGTQASRTCKHLRAEMFQFEEDTLKLQFKIQVWTPDFSSPFDHQELPVQDAEEILRHAKIVNLNLEAGQSDRYADLMRSYETAQELSSGVQQQAVAKGIDHLLVARKLHIDASSRDTSIAI